MNVISLFDGISCARVALDKSKIKVKNYYACEIEKNAIEISKKNYSDIIQLGSVIDFRKNMIGNKKIHLLIGGSPCQDLSIAKKNREGLEGSRSNLFYEYVRIMKLVKPKYFILENVASMPQKDRDIITEIMGVNPVMFNASLVSAQCRKRYFWTNIKFELPIDKGILLKDIIQPDAQVDEKFMCKNNKLIYKNNNDDNGKIPALGYMCNSMIKVGHISNTDSQANRVYSTDGKSIALSANGGGSGAKTGLYTMGRIVGRRINNEGHRDDNNKDIDIKQRIELRNDNKSNNLSTVQKDNILVGQNIRKLTPIECERLQSLPDNYTEGISLSNRYKCLGNAFNVNVVSHILNNIS
jgi:DNA (cytosine-5)-methyltransferase 3A